MAVKLNTPSVGGVARSGMFVVIAMVTQVVISLLSGLVVARAIGPTAYGLFSLARNICEAINLFTKAGFDFGLVRWLPTHAKTVAVGSGYVVASGGVVVMLSLIPVVAVLSGGGEILESKVYSHEGFAGAIGIMIWIIPLMGLTQILSGAFRGYFDVRPGVIAEMLLQPIGRLIIILFLFSMSISLSAVLWGSVASFALALVYLLWCARIYFPVGTNGWCLPSRSVMLSFTKYSVILSLTLSAALLLQRLDILMLGYYRGADEIGQYAILQMAVPLIGLVNSALNQLLAPMVSRLASLNDMAELKTIVHRHCRWVTIISFPVFLIFVVFGVDLLGIFGAAFQANATVIFFMACTQIVMAMLSSSGFLLSMTDRYKKELPILLGNLVMNIILNIWLIQKYGITGAAIATFISVLVANIIRLRIVYRIYAFFTISREVVPPIIVALVMLIPVFIFYRAMDYHSVISAFLAATVYFLIYIAAVYRYGLLDEDRLLAQRFVQRYMTGRAD